MAETTAPASPTGPDASDSTTETKQDTTTPAEKTIEAIRRHRLKVDGAEVEVDDEELKRGYALSKTSYKRLEAAAQARKEAEAYREKLRADPWSVLKELGIDPDTAAEDRVWKRIQAQQMTPEQRAALQYQQESERVKAERDALKAQLDEQKMSQAQKQEAIALDKEITDVLASSDLPKTPRTVARMADLMMKNLELGLTLSAADIVPLVKQEIQTEAVEALKAMSPAQLEKHAPELLKSLRKYDLERIRSKTGRPAEPRRAAQDDDEAPQSKRRGYMSMDELRDEAAKRSAQ